MSLMTNTSALEGLVIQNPRGKVELNVKDMENSGVHRQVYIASFTTYCTSLLKIEFQILWQSNLNYQSWKLIVQSNNVSMDMKSLTLMASGIATLREQKANK